MEQQQIGVKEITEMLAHVSASLEVSKIDRLEAKVDLMMQKIEELNAKFNSNPNPNIYNSITPQSSPSVIPGKINITKRGKGILVTGDTRPIKDILKENSGRWNPKLTGWIFAPSTFNFVLEELNKDSNLNIAVSDEVTNAIEAAGIVTVDA